MLIPLKIVIFLLDVSGPSDRAKVTRKVQNIHRHPKYDPNGKKDKNVLKSFEYDLALVELSQKIEFSPTVRYHFLFVENSL